MSKSDSITFRVPMFPSLNRQQRAFYCPSMSVRQRIGAQAAEKRRYQKNVRWVIRSVLQTRRPPCWARASVTIGLRFTTARNRDLDKWTGAAWWLMDAMVGLLIADDCEAVVGRPHVFFECVDAERQEAEVTVRRKSE